MTTERRITSDNKEPQLPITQYSLNTRVKALADYLLSIFKHGVEDSSDAKVSYFYTNTTLSITLLSKNSNTIYGIHYRNKAIYTSGDDRDIFLSCKLLINQGFITGITDIFNIGEDIALKIYS